MRESALWDALELCNGRRRDEPHDEAARCMPWDPVVSKGSRRTLGPPAVLAPALSNNASRAAPLARNTGTANRKTSHRNIPTYLTSQSPFFLPSFPHPPHPTSTLSPDTCPYNPPSFVPGPIPSTLKPTHSPPALARSPRNDDIRANRCVRASSPAKEVVHMHVAQSRMQHRQGKCVRRGF